MAYKNLVNTTITSMAEFFTHFRDFVCARNATHNYSTTGIGWTYHDSSYSVDEDNPANNDWFVISSTGESGNEQMYFKFELYNTNYIRLQEFLYFDSSTHTGTHATTIASTIYTLNYYKIHIYGDLDAVSGLIDYNNASTCYGTWFGKFSSNFDEGPQTITGALTAGSDVSIVVGDTSSIMFEVDRYAFIYDNDNIERILIKTNNGSTTLTADLTNSFSAGSKLRSCIPYGCDSYQTTFISSTANRIRELMSIIGTYNDAGGRLLYNPPIQATHANPGVQSNINCSPYTLISTTANIGHPFTFPNFYKEFAQSSLSYGDVLVDINDVNYRYFNVGSLIFYFKEV